MSDIPVSFISPPEKLHPLELDHWRLASTWVWRKTQTQAFGHVVKTSVPLELHLFTEKIYVYLCCNMIGQAKTGLFYLKQVQFSDY